MQKFRVKISISEGQLFHGWIDRSETRIIAYESSFIESWWSTSLTHSWGFWNASSLIIPWIRNFVVKLLRLINISFRKGSILFHLELFIWRWSYEILLAYRNQFILFTSKIEKIIVKLVNSFVSLYKIFHKSRTFVIFFFCYFFDSLFFL